MSKAGESFDEVWEKLKADDKTGTFEKAEVLSFISCEALEYAYNSGYATAKAEFERPHGEWIEHSLENLLWGHNECPFCHMRSNRGAHYCQYCGADMRGK